MTDDFTLFPNADSDAANDADIGLITAYLARELSPVQIAAVQDRLDTDAVFRDRMRPLIESWVFPASYREGATRRAAQLSAIRPASPEGRITSRRYWNMKRIAAVIALMVLPMVTLAQVVRYAAAHPGAPGHPVAKRMVAAVSRADEPRSSAPPVNSPIGDNRLGTALWDRIVAGNAGQQSVQPQPAHLLGPVLARSSVTLGSAAQLVALSDGRVLVADPIRRLVQLFDASLANPTVVFDSAMAKPNTFNSGIGAPVTPGAVASTGRGGGSSVVGPPRLAGRALNYLIPFRGDSSLWLDPIAESFVVIDPSGKLTRTMPQPALLSVTNVRPGPPGTSGRFGLVYKVRRIGETGGRGAINDPTVPFLYKAPPRDTVILYEDSAMVVRVHFDTRVIDTVGLLADGDARVISWSRKTQPDGSSAMLRSGGGVGARVLDPLKFVDHMVTTSDGSIVILRAREYRLEWITPDGTRTSQKLNYPWRRVTDDIRKYLLDSATVLFNMESNAAVAKWVADSTRMGRLPVNAGAAPPRVLTPAQQDSARKASAGSYEAIAATMGITFSGASGAWADDAPGAEVLGARNPDYFAPVPPKDALRADGDGNVWIRQVLTTPDPGHQVWEIVNRTSGVIDRVRIPDTRTLIGFGPGGIVYLAAYDGGVARLEKVKVK